MGIVVSFVPWFFYWVFLSCGMLHAAAFSGLVAALALNVKDLRAGRGKILPIGTLIFFFVLSILTLCVHLRLLWAWVPLAGPATLALITLVSILIGKPFTLQYARESVAREYWESKPFILANYRITWAWFTAFLVMSVPDILDHLGRPTPVWFKWLFSLGCCFGAVQFTVWYRKKVRAERQAVTATEK